MQLYRNAGTQSQGDDSNLFIYVSTDPVDNNAYLNRNSFGVLCKCVGVVNEILIFTPIFMDESG